MNTPLIMSPLRWLGWLFGIDSLEAVDAWKVTLAAPWAVRLPWLVAVLAAAVAGGAVWFYLRRQPALPRRTRTVLSLLRAAAGVLIVLLLADPVLQLSVRNTPRPLLWLLFDGSESMAIEDEIPAGERESLATATGLDPAQTKASRTELVTAWVRNEKDNVLDALGEKFRLRAFSIESADGVRPLDAGSADAPDGLDGERLAAALSTAGEVTALGQAFEDLTLRHSIGNLQGVVLVSDFDQNSGPPAPSAARRLGVPVYCVGVGPALAADVAVDLQAPPVMKKDERSTVVVTLRQSGLDDAVAEVSLSARMLGGDAATGRDAGSVVELGAKSVSLSAGTVAVEFPFTPAEAGRQEFTAEVAKLAGESIDSNNRDSRETIVRDDFLRLEYVEYEPTWEWRFVKEVFHRDPLVGERGFRTFLRSADAQVRASNELFLKAPAAARADFFATDVLFLGDMPAAALSNRFCEMAREFVEKFGGGLVVIAGPRFGPAELAETALGDMLPVVFDGPRRPRDDRPFELTLAPEAATVDFMRLGGDEAENRLAWKNLGRLPWWQPVSRPHPQATVLATHPTEKCFDGKTPQPIIAIRRFGRGEVIYVGTNETWRLRKKYGEKYYRQFWGQLMHRLGLSHALGSQKRFVVRTDATAYRTDDKVLVTVEAFDADFQPLDADKLPDRTLSARLVRPGATAPEPVSIAEVRPGLFEARVAALEAGEHRIVVDDPLTREEAAAAFTVTGLSVEQRAAVRNTSLQEAIAAATGGRSYDLASAGKLAGDIDPVARREHTVRVMPLGMTWACLLAGLGLLVAEWILRKRASLA